MLKKTFRTVLLSLMLFASVLMLSMAIITAAIRNASAGMPVIAQGFQTGNAYIMRAHNGHIAVFYGDIKDSPAIETTIEIDSLRAVDREKILQGITVQNYDDVLKLLEDFSS